MGNTVISVEAERIQRLLGQLLMGRRQRGTIRFRDLQHDRDLIPAIVEKLESFADHSEVARIATANVQGPDDAGGDVILRVSSESHSSEYFVFQVKAHNELVGDVYQLLQAQHSSAQDAYSPMVRYFILPFGVAENDGFRSDGKPKILKSDRRKAVQVIQKRFIKKNDVTVVEPAYLAAFLSLNTTRIDAFVRSVLGDNDPVRRVAQRELQGLRLSQVLTLLKCLSEEVALGGRPIQRQELEADSLHMHAAASGLSYIDGQLQEEDWPRDVASIMGDEVVAADLDGMGDALEIDDSGRISLVRGANPGLVALATDGHVRFGHTGAALADYLAWMLNVDAFIEGAYSIMDGTTGG